MSLIPELSSPYLTAFASGLLYGLVACTSTCLPYLASYIAGAGTGFRKSIIVTLTFNVGRIIAYALIGALAGVFSSALWHFTSESAISPFQTYSSIAFSIVTIIIGAHLLYKNWKPKCECTTANAEVKTRKIYGILDLGALTLGLTRGLILCPPLITLLAYSITFATPVDTLVLAVFFGVGTAISPMLILGGVTGWLLNKAPLLRRWIGLGGALVLILLGVITLITSIAL